MISANEVALRLDLGRTRKGWRGTCPACGYPTTFVLTSRRGQANGWCASCRDDGAIRAALAGLGGHSPSAATSAEPNRPIKTDAERTAEALAIWNGATESHPSLTAYCAYRGLDGLEQSPALRWRSDATHPDLRSRVPAMIALVQDVHGRPVAIHRTYTLANGQGKAQVTPQKTSKGPLWGGAIRLHDAAPELLIAEGIETAEAAGRMVSLPCWSGVSAGNIEHSLELPQVVRAVVIAADNDLPGQRAADRAALRWSAQGRAVRIITPDRPGEDFADLHRASGTGP